MTDKTPREEAEELVDGIVDDKRRQIVEENEDLIEKVVEKLSNYREMNAVFSEIRRRLD